MADVLIRKVEETLLPGLRKAIEVREVATPLTNVRYTKNPEGAILGYEYSLDNCFINRIKNQTPIKGLYLASAWGNPGGRFMTVMRSGRATFKTLMEDWGYKM